MKSRQENKTTAIPVIVGFCVLGALAFLAVVYSQYAGTRLIAPTGPRLRVKTGEIQTVTYKTSARTPHVKIDLCKEKLPPAQCVTLAQKVGGRQTNVQIPYDYPFGKALLVVWEREPSGKLTGKMQFRRPLLVVQGPPPPPPSPTPHPGAGGPPKTVVSERVGRKLEVTAPEPMIVGKRVPVAITYRAKDEPGTYKGELQVTQITTPDIFNIQPPRLDDISGGVMRWPYELQAGQTFTVTLEIKVPPIAYRGDSLNMHVQAGDSLGPLVGSTGVWTTLYGEWRITEK